MKSTQAWGWLTAGILALGLNGIYHDGGADWAHRAADQVMAQIGDKTESVLALATGRADRFVAKTSMVAAQDQTASCRFGTAMARLQTKMARAQSSSFAGFEAMSAQEEAQVARFEENRARIEAHMARVRLAPAAFNGLEIPVICPRVNVRVPRISGPRIPTVRIPEIHVEVAGAGPV